jgi:hypothetical protein
MNCESRIDKGVSAFGKYIGQTIIAASLAHMEIGIDNGLKVQGCFKYPRILSVRSQLQREVVVDVCPFGQSENCVSQIKRPQVPEPQQTVVKVNIRIGYI